jgi:hypothetical protein
MYCYEVEETMVQQSRCPTKQQHSQAACSTDGLQLHGDRRQITLTHSSSAMRPCQLGSFRHCLLQCMPAMQLLMQHQHAALPSACSRLVSQLFYATSGTSYCKTDDWKIPVETDVGPNRPRVHWTRCCCSDRASRCRVSLTEPPTLAQ